MKTHEMIKALSENPLLTARLISGYYGIEEGNYEVFVLENGDFVDQDFEDAYLSIFDEWEVE